MSRRKPSLGHQFSHTTSGSTVLMIFQWEMAPCLRHLSSVFAFARPKTSSSPTCVWKTLESTSCVGYRYSSLKRLPRTSAWVGLRNEKVDAELIQKMTRLVKSCSTLVSAGASSSRKIRQDGKTDMMVRMISRAGGSRRSPA